MKKLLANLRLRSGAAPSETAFTQSQSANFDPNKAVTVFMANRFNNAIDQIMMFFDGGFLTPQSTQLTFQYFPATFERVVAACLARGIEWHCFGANAYLPDVKSKLILYPFNNKENVGFITKNAVHHVLLMHGESNKVALTKPLARIYDHVIVAGDIAVERFIEFGVFTSHDVSNGRVIKLGTSAVGEFPMFVRADDDAPKVVLYCPTWEGGNDAENLSSLSWSAGHILTGAKSIGSNHIAIRLHPHTGERLHPYRGHVFDLIRCALSEGMTVSYLCGDSRTLLEQSLEEQIPELTFHDYDQSGPLPVTAAFTDVSALEAVMDAKDIPVHVLADETKTVAMPKTYRVLCAERLIWKQTSKAGHYPAFERASPAIVKYRKELITYTDEKLRSLPEAARLGWLAEFIENCEYWRS